MREVIFKQEGINYERLNDGHYIGVQWENNVRSHVIKIDDRKWTNSYFTNFYQRLKVYNSLQDLLEATKSDKDCKNIYVFDTQVELACWLVCKYHEEDIVSHLNKFSDVEYKICRT